MGWLLDATEWHFVEHGQGRLSFVNTYICSVLVHSMFGMDRELIHLQSMNFLSSAELRVRIPRIGHGQERYSMSIHI